MKRKLKLAFEQLERDLPLEEKYKANCFGLAIAHGDYWFWDDPTTTGQNEFAGFDTFMDTFYTTTTKSGADLAVVKNDGMAYHAGIVNSDGTYTAKGGIGAEQTFNNESAFRYGTNDPSAASGPYTSGAITYYKRKP